MRMDGKTVGGAIVIAVVFWLIGAFVTPSHGRGPFYCIFGCPKPPPPPDGNPVSYHLDGLARIDGKTLAVAGCQTTDKKPRCTVKINIATGKKGAPPGNDVTPCPTANNCFNVAGTGLTLSSVDSNTPHPEEPVSVAGAVEIVTPAP